MGFKQLAADSIALHQAAYKVRWRAVFEALFGSADYVAEGLCDRVRFGSMGCICMTADHIRSSGLLPCSHGAYCPG